MNTAKELYDRWLAQPELDTAMAEELHGIAGDDAAITDRFYRDLEFGTGGLRGVLGAGTNRMNLYTVRKATQGLADYLNATDLPKKIAIAHDSRNNGELFTREAARVLAANGITACVYPRLEPTPALSWAVRYLAAGQASALQPATTRPSTTAIKCMAPMAARSRWKWQIKFWLQSKKWTALTA